MKKRTKCLFLIGGILFLLGGMIFTGVMTMCRWDFSKFSTTKYETNSYEIRDPFGSIVIRTVTADIRFELSDDNTVSVVCHEETNIRHTVSVKDGALTVEAVDTRKWYEHIGISFDQTTVTVTLPRGTYGDLRIESGTGGTTIPEGLSFLNADISETTGDIAFSASASGALRLKTTTGDIRLADSTVGSAELSLSTGDITVSDVTATGDLCVKVTTGATDVRNVRCLNFSSSGTTGDVTLTEVFATDALSVARSTGNVHFDRAHAASMTVNTGTGSVTGSLAGEMIVFAQSGTGKIIVPRCTEGGRCDVTTGTGNILLSIG